MPTNCKQKFTLGLSILLLLIMVYIMCSKPKQITSTFTVASVSSSKIILFWTLCFGGDFIQVHRMASGDIVCGAQRHKCYVTNNKTLLSQSSAVIFHTQGANFMSSLFAIRSMKRPQWQHWVCYNRDTPAQSVVGINALRQWNSLFNWTMSYKLDSDIRYAFGKIIPGEKFQGGFDPKKNYLEGKQKTATILVSNCRKDRFNLLKSVKKYIDVDIYGNCGKRCIPHDKCFSYIPKYKFYLAFENSICQDLLTEKTFVNALMKGVVPVIISGANLSSPVIIPPKSFINARNFQSAKELADYLKHIGSDPKLYNEYFKWRDYYNITIFGSNPKDFPCSVCEKLYEPNQEVKIIQDIGSWYSAEYNCKPYPVWT